MPTTWDEFEEVDPSEFSWDDFEIEESKPPGRALQPGDFKPNIYDEIRGRGARDPYGNTSDLVSAVANDVYEKFSPRAPSNEAKMEADLAARISATEKAAGVEPIPASLKWA